MYALFMLLSVLWEVTIIYDEIIMLYFKSVKLRDFLIISQ